MEARESALHARISASRATDASMQGINFGGLMFTYPVPLHASITPPESGLYSVQVADRSFGPLPYRPIYFGQSGRLVQQNIVEHPRLAQWASDPRGRDGLFVSFFPTGTMPETTRLEFVGRLLAQYLQPWNLKQVQAAVVRALED